MIKDTLINVGKGKANHVGYHAETGVVVQADTIDETVLAVATEIKILLDRHGETAWLDRSGPDAMLRGDATEDETKAFLELSTKLTRAWCQASLLLDEDVPGQPCIFPWGCPTKITKDASGYVVTPTRMEGAAA